MIIAKGNNSVGAYHFPDKKKPHICYCIGNEIYDCGHFNNEDSAERFMMALADILGLKQEKNMNIARERNKHE